MAFSKSVRQSVYVDDVMDAIQAVKMAYGKE